ncbi:hypothetical protein C0583_07115 [Candidatus Parcubacteria bacterium]|nr:MAG: hypothetical protein C0583_07115 [Candidatus Parcubacteria bacterium]
MLSNPYLNALAIVAIFWLGSYIITIAIGLIGKLTSKTKTDLDDRIIKAIKLPIRYFAIILGFYYGFKSFAWTWTLGSKEMGISDLMVALVILTAGFMISRLVKTVFTWYGEKDNIIMSQTMFIFLRRIINIVIYAVILMIVFSQLGIEITPLLASLGIAGLAIAMGLKPTIESLFAALFLVMDKSINVGDWIQLADGTKAYIEDISWRTVRIRTIGGNTVIVPNNVFANEIVSSYDYPEKHFTTSITVGVSYDTDLEKAEYIATQAAEKVIKEEGITLQENNPTIRYNLLDASSINFSIYVKVDTVQDEGRIKHALIKEIVKQFKENNIEIPFPQMVIHKNNE